MDKVTPFDVGLLKHPFNRECNRVSTWARLAVDIFHDSRDYEDGHQRHLFVTALRPVWETIQMRTRSSDFIMPESDDETPNSLAELQLCMVHALWWSLAHSAPNCGAYTSSAWIEGILRCYETANEISMRENVVVIGVPFTAYPSLRPTFLLVLRLLSTCLERGLLTERTAGDDFAHLFTLLGNPELPALSVVPESMKQGTATVQQAMAGENVSALEIRYLTKP